ncbi:unnamed protein product, partial [Protopolystoma xenopodis]
MTFFRPNLLLYPLPFLLLAPHYCVPFLLFSHSLRKSTHCSVNVVLHANLPPFAFCSQLVGSETVCVAIPDARQSEELRARSKIPVHTSNVAVAVAGRTPTKWADVEATADSHLEASELEATGDKRDGARVQRSANTVVEPEPLIDLALVMSASTVALKDALSQARRASIQDALFDGERMRSLLEATASSSPLHGLAGGCGSPSHRSPTDDGLGDSAAEEEDSEPEWEAAATAGEEEAQRRDDRRDRTLVETHSPPRSGSPTGRLG